MIAVNRMRRGKEERKESERASKRERERVKNERVERVRVRERKRAKDINRSQRKYPGIRCVYRQIDAVSLVNSCCVPRTIRKRIASARYQSAVYFKK